MLKAVDAVTRLDDLILRAILGLDKFSRNRKFLLAGRIETHLLDILELLTDAAYSRARRKQKALHAANLNDRFLLS